MDGQLTTDRSNWSVFARMGSFIWRFRFARILAWRTGIPFRQAWQVSDSAEIDNEWGFTPSQAVDEELSYWGP